MERQTFWTDKDIEEMLLARSRGASEPPCPICEGKVTIKIIEGGRKFKKEICKHTLFSWF